MRITEIFHSIQGESSYAGQPCVFVRLTGCPLRCTWCDTDYAFFGGHECSIDEALTRYAPMNAASWRSPEGNRLLSPRVSR